MGKGRIAVAGAMAVVALGLVGMHELTEREPVDPPVVAVDRPGALGAGGALSPDGIGSLPMPSHPTGSTSTTTTLVRRHDPGELDILLDPDGRPYDATGPDLSTSDVAIEEITTLVLDDGLILTMGGEGLVWPDDPTRTLLDADRGRAEPGR